MTASLFHGAWEQHPSPPPTSERMASTVSRVIYSGGFPPEPPEPFGWFFKDFRDSGGFLVGWFAFILVVFWGRNLRFRVVF